MAGPYTRQVNGEVIVVNDINELQIGIEEHETRVVSLEARNDVQAVAYAATVTPNPALGGIINIGALTGNITLAAPATSPTGTRLTLNFVQDATGGRAVTWNAVYSTTWQPNAVASSRSSVVFVYDGVAWLEESRFLRRGGVHTITATAVNVVNIAHGLGRAPTIYGIAAANVGARGAPAVFLTVTATNIVLNFAANLVNATVYSWVWHAEI